MRKFIFICLLLLLGIGEPSLPAASLSPGRSLLENGLVLLTSEQRALPIVTFHLLIMAGSRYDPKGREGLAGLTARLLTYGTSKRTALEISETMDFIGASLTTRGSRELASISLNILKKDLGTGLQLLAEILTDSVFPSEEVERQKNRSRHQSRPRKKIPER